MFRSIAGFLLGLTPLIIAGIFGVVIYSTINETAGIILAAVLSALAVWAGLNIFRQVRFHGPFNFIVSVFASRDLDKLEPDADSKTKRREVSDLISLYNKGENLFQGGKVRIYGDWFSESSHSEFEIQKLSYDESEGKLTIAFKEGEKIEVYNPGNIFESPSFLKILDAEKVRITWLPKEKEKSNYLEFKKNSKEISTISNIDIKQSSFNLSLGEPALLILS